MLKNRVILMDALYNVHNASGASDDYSRGLVVGVVATLMSATGMSYEEAVRLIKSLLHHSFDPNRIPSAFRNDFTGDSDNG